MAPTRRYLLASLLISEGSGTVYHMGTIYALSVCNIGHNTVFAATFASRVLGVFMSLAWEILTRRLGARNCYLFVGALMLVNTLLCATLFKAWQYWLLVILLSITGTGGSQPASKTRSKPACRCLQNWHHLQRTCILPLSSTQQILVAGFAIGRSLLATLAPPDKASEIFGFNSFAGQVAGVFGPLIFSTVAQVPLLGSSEMRYLIATTLLSVVTNTS